MDGPLEKSQPKLQLSLWGKQFRAALSALLLLHLGYLHEAEGGQGVQV